MCVHEYFHVNSEFMFNSEFTFNTEFTFNSVHEHFHSCSVFRSIGECFHEYTESKFCHDCINQFIEFIIHTMPEKGCGMSKMGHHYNFHTVCPSRKSEKGCRVSEMDHPLAEATDDSWRETGKEDGPKGEQQQLPLTMTYTGLLMSCVSTLMRLQGV